MTEKFGIDGAFRDSATVDGKIVLVFSRTILMYDLRNDIFTGSALTINQDGKVGAGNLNRNLNRAIEMRVVTYYLKSLFY